jgi:hypothetical protein
MKATLRFLLSMALFIGSLGFTQASSGAGCAREWCSDRSDGNRWCCRLKSEDDSNGSCTYYNHTVGCYKATAVQAEESQSD